MTEVEKLEFTECVGMIMSMTYSAYVQHEQELIDDEVWQAYQNAALARLANPGFREVWLSVRTSYPGSFQAAMAHLISGAGLPAGPT